MRLFFLQPVIAIESLGERYKLMTDFLVFIEGHVSDMSEEKTKKDVVNLEMIDQERFFILYNCLFIMHG
jgi:hypothetical protein